MLPSGPHLVCLLAEFSQSLELGLRWPKFTSNWSLLLAAALRRPGRLRGVSFALPPIGPALVYAGGRDHRESCWLKKLAPVRKVYRIF